MAWPCLIYQCKHAQASVPRQMLCLVVTFSWQAHTAFSCASKVRGSRPTLSGGAWRKCYFEKQICATRNPAGHYSHTRFLFASPDWLRRHSHIHEAELPKRPKSSILWTQTLSEARLSTHDLYAWRHKQKQRRILKILFLIEMAEEMMPVLLPLLPQMYSQGRMLACKSALGERAVRCEAHRAVLCFYFWVTVNMVTTVPYNGQSGCK